MELTQKIECTQELYDYISEKEVPDQIGFLGICGVKYPLKKGPNKIGRDPDTCSIVLNLNSISRQHAVINILNRYDFMLMDLDSANKTKLADKTLQAYIPTPLKNGDMVQFGQVFGVFRLFEEDNDLPMTQALDIPETPVRNQQVSKVNLITTIPESPEVSDRDDSFIVASQPKPRNVFKSPSKNFIKSSGKTITIKPVGLNKIDNVYWSSSKKSDSFNLESETSMNLNSDMSLQTSKTKENIHEQDTQVHNNTNNFIYEADTQVGDNIPSIYNIETQLPRVDNLPEVHKVHGQENVNIDFFTENKENDNNIYNSETPVKCEESNHLDRSSNKNDVSEDIILFEEINNSPVEENFESQPLLLPEIEAINHIEPINKKNIEISDLGEKQLQNIPVSDRRDSGSSTDCEDLNFALTQNILETRTNDDDTTDCEDAPEITNELNKNYKAVGNSNIDDNLTDYEDGVVDNNIGQKEKIDNIDIEDLATQIIEEIPSNCDIRPSTSKTVSCLEDLSTQIIDLGNNNRKENSRDLLDLEDLPTQILQQESQNFLSKQDTSFKIPAMSSPFKRKRKEKTEVNTNKRMIVDKNNSKDSDDEEKYYAATQELLNDLCTQRELSPEVVSFAVATKNASKGASNNNQTNIISNTDLKEITEDIDKKIDKFVKNLTNSAIKDVDIEKEVAPLKKVSSDSSDIESTPKKLRPLSFLETKLPNTDEIKKYLKLSGYASTESSKSSDTDSKRGSPHIKKHRKVVTRVDLTTKFESDKLPEKVVTRVRKPTSKMQYTKDCKKNSNKILQSPSFETGHRTEKEAIALIATSTSKLKGKSKKKTNETENKKNNEGHNINKSKDNNNSKENGKIRENNKDKKNNKIQESDRSKERTKIAENKEIQGNNKNKGRRKGKEKNNNENTIRSNDNKNKPEQKSTRKSSRTKEKQNEVRNDDKQLKVIRDEVRPLKTETSTSNRKTNGRLGIHSKINHRESNTIDKYLSSTPAKVIHKDESKTIEKSSRSENKGAINREEPIETEVRRSKRQRTAKRSFDTLDPKSKQIKLSNHEQSAVYNNSSESGIDSPNKLKRQATEFNLPMAKKTKTMNSSNVVLRSTPARKIKAHYVLFTAFPCDEVKFKLEKLGAVVVTDIMQCTVVLTLQIRRTFKLLCAVGLGKPIVGPNWVQACVDTNMIVDPWQYLIKDEITEKRFQFKLERILLGNRQFLKGYNVSSTPNIMPSPPEMKLIVECSGGTWANGGKNWICVSSSSDKSLWTSLKRKGATIVSTEFILGGVLRQTIDIQKNKLA